MYIALSCIYEHMTLNCLGVCCDQFNIQSNGPAAMYLGDFVKDKQNDHWIRDGLDFFLFKDPEGDWVVCTNS